MPQAQGVGAPAKVSGVALIPVEILGVSGIVEFAILQEDVPPLLPNQLLIQVEVIIDSPDRHLSQRVSKLRPEHFDFWACCRRDDIVSITVAAYRD